jgi:hypothetical protein
MSPLLAKQKSARGKKNGEFALPPPAVHRRLNVTDACT